MTPITKQQVEELIKSLVDTKWGIEGGCFVFTSRVLIGDVLENMEKREETVELRDVARLLNLWRACGFTKSLQDIATGIEYEMAQCEYIDQSRCADYLKACSVCYERYQRYNHGLPIDFEVAKHSPATHLFQFLIPKLLLIK